MDPVNGSSDFSSEMEVDDFRRLFPLRFHERHLLESIRPDSRPLGKARDTTLALGAVASANGSVLAKIGCTVRFLRSSLSPYITDVKSGKETMLAAIKMEVMTPTTESPDEGCIGNSSTLVEYLCKMLAQQDCTALTRQRVNELQKIPNEAISDMEVD